MLSGYDELSRDIKRGLPTTVAIYNDSRRSVVIILSGPDLGTKQPLQIFWDDRAELNPHKDLHIWRLCV